MPRRSCPLFALAALVATVMVIASGCISGQDHTAAVPTPEREQTALLPPTPQDATPEPSVAPEAIVVVELPDVVVPPTDVASIDCLSPRTRIAQLLLPLAAQHELDVARSLAAAGELGGLGLLGEPNSDIAAAITELQNSSFVPVLIASDEEGGSVQRLAALLGPLPSAATTATTRTVDETRAMWLEYGSRVKALGIDVIFGPVVDVGGGPGIESRSFGDDPAIVIDYAGAVVDGLQAAGVMAVLKHFPGHGRASADSHLGLPLAPSIDELRAVDLVPYGELLAATAASQQPAVMVAHLSVPGLSGDLPTSLSADTIDGLLRRELGFEGIVFTDALNMGAIVDGFGTADAVELALRAGADIAILGSLSDVAPVIDHLLAVAEDDAAFADLLAGRTRRVLESKGQAAICQGAQ